MSRVSDTHSRWVGDGAPLRIVRDFQSVIGGRRTEIGKEGGCDAFSLRRRRSNALHFIIYRDPRRLIGASGAAGRYAIHAAPTPKEGSVFRHEVLFLPDRTGDRPVYSISAGLDYPGSARARPLSGYRAGQYVPVTTTSGAFQYLSGPRHLPPSKRHALATQKDAPAMGKTGPHCRLSGGRKVRGHREVYGVKSIIDSNVFHRQGPIALSRRRPSLKNRAFI